MNIAVSCQRVRELAVSVEPLTPTTKINDVADLFLSERYRELLCLPVVENGKVAGTISRYAIMKIFLQSYGREIFGARPVANFMNAKPLLVDINTDIEEASRYVHAHISNPITEDFVIIEDNHFFGMGMVLSLLELLEKRAETRNRALQTANRHLKSSQARLIQSEKMASLGQMVAGVAHEINTPLGYVQSNIELAADLSQSVALLADNNQSLLSALLDKTADDGHIESAIQASIDSVDEVVKGGLLSDMNTLFADSLHGLSQIGELVTNLKNFSRLDHVKLSQVNLNECLDSALNIGRNIIKQKAEIIRDYDQDASIECVASQINQVFLNILTNAAQAIEHYGSIKVKTRARETFVDVHIRDNGRGMPETVRKKIFDPFFTTKAVGEGTGLGLSISYQIVQQHKGLIDVRSIENKGTEFVIRLPRKQLNPSALQEPT
ncbi:ATP-binding protein [Gilvimarinus algae]|uniref:histidine kinase n=1 Tax=Gilvimarinus algae TaxID=3058037 RepID=A0ABT8TJ29_9GAMM|nr:ATP-binding protein [Gilvimarinus sp. SDUM040014]MDO3383363.1 ATP-binding protein [Gilvimarinus sp. SDUM040014]